MFFLPAAQFVYRKDLVCTNALLTISHRLQKFLDTRRESYIVQLDFSATFDRVERTDLIFKLKSFGVGGSVLPICREGVVVDGATSEWIPIVSGVPQGCVVSSSVQPLCQ